MKAISIRQPWAWLILNGLKDIENRAWYTDYRGTVFIHAPSQFDTAITEAFVRQRLTDSEWSLFMRCCNAGLETNGIIGKVTLIDCLEPGEFNGSPWRDPSRHGWVFANPKPLPFLRCRGQLGLWNFNHGGYR